MNVKMKYDGNVNINGFGKSGDSLKSVKYSKFSDIEEVLDLYYKKNSKNRQYMKSFIKENDDKIVVRRLGKNNFHLIKRNDDDKFIIYITCKLPIRTSKDLVIYDHSEIVKKNKSIKEDKKNMISQIWVARGESNPKTFQDKEDFYNIITKEDFDKFITSSTIHIPGFSIKNIPKIFLHDDSKMYINANNLAIKIYTKAGLILGRKRDIESDKVDLYTNIDALVIMDILRKGAKVLNIT
jgi:hypothetical protein